MPDLSGVQFTAQQGARIAAAFGEIPMEGEPPTATMTPLQWIEFNVKKHLKNQVRKFEQEVAGNAAYDAARTQVDADFPGM